MRCSFYSTSSEYNTIDLIEFFKKQSLETLCFDEVIYVKQGLENSSNIIEMFFFPFGSVAIWESENINKKQILQDIKPFEIDSFPHPYSDFINFEYSDIPSQIDEEQNIISLSDKSAFTKLSVSYALAQSVKLRSLEDSVNTIIKNTAPIQQQLASSGSVSLSRKEIAKQIGQLFSKRYSINLHSNILDTPEFFWRRPKYEPLYLSTVTFQDISVRQKVLNHRLDMIHELYSVLSNELNNRYSERIEITIVILITMEVILGLSHSSFIQSIF